MCRILYLSKTNLSVETCLKWLDLNQSFASISAFLMANVDGCALEELVVPEDVILIPFGNDDQETNMVSKASVYLLHPSNNN